jgi:enoyl-CoA hydratase/carnithine racemase
VRIVVLRADGPVFSSGLNLSFADPHNAAGLGGLLRLTDAELLTEIEVFQQAFTWWGAVPAITICVVEGAAVGAGFQLALATDLRIATPAARFAMREVTLGLVPDLGGTGRLLDLVGYPVALDICVTARWVDLNRLVPAPDLDRELADLVGQVLSADAGAVAAIKALLHGGVGRGRSDQLRSERAAQIRQLRALGKD